jgi:hypothetical protein
MMPVLKTEARMMDFFDRQVGGLIMQRYGQDEVTTLRNFMGSETYTMLSDDELKLWHFSPLVISDMWENERATGDPRNSLYLRGDEIE